MKALLLVPVLACAAALSGCMTPSAKNLELAVNNEPPVAKGEKQPVLVELFTSEGCSSCPPADKVLTILQNDQLVPNAEVITLGYHVDYWDHDGWKDRFSSHAFTVRQENYARQFRLDSTYTPQIVVDGRRELIGSNRAQANDAIAESANAAKAEVELKMEGEELRATISGLGIHQDSTVYLATAESKLSTNIGGGENNGKLLEHTSVVRELVEIGKIRSTEASGKFETTVTASKDWKIENVKYVVFVQEGTTLRILAVKQIGR